MRQIDLSADALVQALTAAEGRKAHILDSCGVGRVGANRLIGGLEPVHVEVISGRDARESLALLERLIDSRDLASVFTIGYDLGARLHGTANSQISSEPDIYVALFDRLFFHNYDTGATFQIGRVDEPIEPLSGFLKAGREHSAIPDDRRPPVRSNFTRSGYIEAVSRIQELIRAGETYQTNLTQQFEAPLPDGRLPSDVFLSLRRDHPAPYAALIERPDSTVISVSPEQFFMVESKGSERKIVAEPIKGTRPRGLDNAEDKRLRTELAASEKDRAENVMIVDLMRNDLGRICEFGSVRVDDLYRIDEHPTLFHLVSTVSGVLRNGIGPAEILEALFPCGSITGAPKIRTMQLIDEIELVPRGLSMGAIGCRIPESFGLGEIFEASVAIRTMVVRDGVARFNVGGGIVIDSDPIAEYEESLLKAKALFRALGVNVAGSSQLSARAEP
ncbi:MAG: anthranilate synthase component I family protein [Pyrinomonadaceae bacterium]